MMMSNYYDFAFASFFVSAHESDSPGAKMQRASDGNVLIMKAGRRRKN